MPSVSRHAWWLLLVPLAHVHADELRYDWLTQGERSGGLVVRIDEDGTRRSHFEFTDRGRGPNQDERIVLDTAGLIRELEIGGRSYLGARVDERFASDDGRAHWTTALDRGEHRGTQPTFYAANDGTPDQIGILARALLAQPERRLALLPAGEARIETLQTRTLSRGKTSREITLYAITGLDFTPSYVWLDESQQLFALSYGWMGLLPEGWSSAFAQVRDWQEQAETALLRQRAKALTERLPERWCVRGVRALDVEAGALRDDAAVRVHAGRIDAVGAAGSIDCDGLRTIDGGGRVLMPGLWDMHAHLSASDGLLNISAGVTGARDLANDHDRIMQLQAQFDSGELIGPRVQRAGFIDRRSPYTAPTGMPVATLAEALTNVDWYADRGYPQIKIYSSIDPDWVKPIAERVHARGMRLSGHVPAFMTAERAIADGFDEIQHINMLFLNFLAGTDADTRTPVRFELVAQKGGDLDLDSPEVDAFIAMLARRGIVVDSTVSIFDQMFRHRSGEVSPSLVAVVDHLPPTVRRGVLSGRMAIDDGNAAGYARSADALLRMLRKLYEAGVPLVPGTDAMAGFTLHRELELYAKAGIPTAEVLRIATLRSAKIAGFGDSVGRIAPGQAADLILIDGDPLADISALRRTALVLRGDRAYRPDTIHPVLGIRPFVPSVR